MPVLVLSNEVDTLVYNKDTTDGKVDKNATVSSTASLVLDGEEITSGVTYD
jgi:hypothetical protein